MNKKIIFGLIGILLSCFLTGLEAEETSLLKLNETLFNVPSPTGYEKALVEVIQGILPPGSTVMRDNLGSLYWKREEGASRVAVCTPMDEVGYFVSGIDRQGFLRIDKAVYGPPLTDSYHLGHPVTVWAEKGPIEGVLALPSLHILSSEVRKAFEERPSLELAYVDIGVASADEAREKGAAMMDAVTPWREITMLAGSKMAGYSLGLKFCTALALDAALQLAGRQVVSNPAFVWMAQTKLMLRRSRPPSALGAFRASEELEADRIVIIDVFPCDPEESAGIRVGSGPVLVHSTDKQAGLVNTIQEWAREKGLSFQTVPPGHRSPIIQPFLSGSEEVVGLLLPVEFAKTPSEVVDFGDAQTLGSLLSMLLQEGGLE